MNRKITIRFIIGMMVLSLMLAGCYHVKSGATTEPGTTTEQAQ